MAAVTIPTLVRDIQDKQFKVAFKKDYSTFAQATKILLQDAGGSFVGFFTNEAHFAREYSKYLKTAKYCSNNVKGNCWHNNGDVKGLDGNIYLEDLSNYRDSVILSNGTLVYMLVESSNCTFSGTYNHCGSMLIDVNGFKGPNTLGRDIYGIWIRKDEIAPWGTPNDRYLDPPVGDPHKETCTSSKSGTGCAYKVLMNEDY